MHQPSISSKSPSGMLDRVPRGWVVLSFAAASWGLVAGTVCGLAAL